ncbi:thioesterase II family protein [Streptomyces sp. TRM68367]|uniref:thioesterase II family protein n=1 Tax=Streptomyces sp. TRM68367 TaxID=2758415 RepID=UPI00165B7B0C|nr:alpha/beta fold hydrolase [Streptomyces sp. TRM68367]MBC9726549.1 thioesterase [Streptomyces sp. TRM68367]
MNSATERAGRASQRWFHRPEPRPEARIRLVCVPYAGAGAGVFRHWTTGLPTDVELVAVRLPGRENRVREQPYSDWPALVAAFSAALMEQVPPPYMLFGHSMGGMLAYEVASRGIDNPPERVIVSGCRAPGAPRTLPAIHHLPDAQLAEALGGLAGTPPQVLANPELLALLMPMLRADLRLAETWPTRSQGLTPPVPVPVTTFCGTDDDIAPEAAVTAWRPLAPRGFRSHRIPGGHFFLHDSADETVRLLCSELARN